MKEPFYKYATETTILYNFMVSMEQGCNRCTLSDSNHKPIVYRGNPEADIMLIGEAPGKVEQEKRTPFVGPAGQLLDNIMSSIGISTEDDIFITNCVYCRPTATDGSGKQNYTPKEEQLQRCKPFLKNLIHGVIRPKVIIACGRVALSQLTDKRDIRIGDMEGKWHHYREPFTRGIGDNTKAIPMFTMTHPAAILHMSKDPEAQKQKKLQVWEYMQEFRDSWKDKAYENLASDSCTSNTASDSNDN